MGREKELYKELPIVMAKELAASRYQMTLDERRLLFVAMSKIHPDDKEFGTVRFTKAEYIKLLEEAGIKAHGGNQWAEIKRGVINLLQEIVCIEEEPGVFNYFQWASKSRIDTKTGDILFKFHDEMKPFLIEMVAQRGYTKFLLKFALPLTSLYAAKFYEYFRGMVWQEHPITKHKMTIEEIRELMCLDFNAKGKSLEKPLHPLYKNLKSKVIQQAEKEINGKTDISVSFKEIRSRKQGRRVESLTFQISLKESDAFGPWERYLLWEENELNAAIMTFVAQKRNIPITLSNSIPNSELRRSAKARILYELRHDMHDLEQILYPQQFISALIKEYALDEMALKQIGIVEYYQNKELVKKSVSELTEAEKEKLLLNGAHGRKRLADEEDDICFGGDDFDRGMREYEAQR